MVFVSPEEAVQYTALLAFQDGESNGEYESILFAPEDHKSYLAWLAAAVDEGGDQTLQDKMTDDALEPDPRHRKEALAHPRFRKFWLEGEKEEQKYTKDQGSSVEATKGLKAFIGLSDDKSLSQLLEKGTGAMQDECIRHGSLQ